MGKKIMENTFTPHLLSAGKNKADAQKEVKGKESVCAL